VVTNQTNNASQASEQRYRQLFVNMPICIFVVNLTASPATILEVNKRAELVYGYKAVELVGNPATNLVPDESRANIQNMIQRVRRGETVTTEAFNSRRDGTIFPVRIIATLDPTNSGHMIITAEDITAERQRRSETEAIESERLRIAHEIHDGVAQNLAGLRFKSALWSHLADTAPPSMRAALDELQSVLFISIDDIRRAIFALRPVDLESMGFFPALTQLIADFGAANKYLSGVVTCAIEGNGIGALRTLTSDDGSTVVERLETLDEVNHQLSYILLTDTPFRNCLTTMVVGDLGPNLAEMEWIATFEPDGIPASEAEQMLESAQAANCLALKKFIEQ
jgi:PAS domain S-box-containing protein